MEDKRSYYAIIPANIRYDKNITPNAKLLYGEITALCNEKGYCWATNEYFSKLYGVSKQSISKWIKSLKDNNYISVEMIYREGTKEILNRYIKIIEYPMKENLNTPIQENANDPMQEKLKENNTFSFNTTLSFNTTSNRLKKERKKNGYDEILSTIEDDSLRELYVDYIKMRKLIKAPMTDRALTMLINKVNELEPYDIERQKKMLENAIVNNWKSVYPLKEEKQTQQKQTTRKSQVAQELDDFYHDVSAWAERSEL